MDEFSILKLTEVADAYGIGTAFSNAPVLDFSMDIVEIEGKPIAKRGKLSGRKDVCLCLNCLKTIVVPFNKPVSTCSNCNKEFNQMLQPLNSNGKLVNQIQSPQEIREYVKRQLIHFNLTI